MVSGTESVFPAVAADRLFLTNASGLRQFRPVYDCLSTLTILEPAPRGIYDWAQSQGDSNTLSRRFDHLAKKHPATKRVIEEYLQAVAPQFDRLDVSTLANFKFLRFVEKLSNGGGETSFGLNQVSTGLLNAAAMLLELFEPPKEGRPSSLVAIEEPEAFLHPSAVRVMRDAFLEASETRQILITSHSPELLDDPSIPAEWIRVVYRDGAETHIEPLSDSTSSIIRDRLFTAGELMRQGGLKS
jgi:predicted ATPase